jgi:hypothetical protein
MKTDESIELINFDFKVLAVMLKSYSKAQE